MSHLLTGVPASPGIAIAKAYRLEMEESIPQRKEIEDRAAEMRRLKEAIESAKVDIDRIREQTLERLGPKKAEIFEAHLFLLDDPELTDAALARIEREGVCAEFALYDVAAAIMDALRSMDNEMLRERAADVEDITRRVINKLEGRAHHTFSELSDEAILFAKDLTPSDTAQLNMDYIRGFVTEMGSRTSHSAIMARSLELAAVVGAGTEASHIRTGDTVILDATSGKIIVNPSRNQMEDYSERKRKYEDDVLRMKSYVDRPSVTADEVHVELAGNIGGIDDLEKVLANGADGIGLFRTEFLYMGRSTFPSEEEQYSVYKHVLQKMNGKRVVIRTLDIGGDKELSYMQLPQEMNPFLGLRAIRLCLDREDLFRTQLRALLRASAHGKLAIMFPMISILSELREAKRILNEERIRLEQEGVMIASELEVGIMIETPAAALAADILAEEVDFFSIGTNDLIQYTMAADRMNESVSYLYQPHHPVILRMVQLVIQAADRHGKWAGMCGEMAGDASAIPLLLGLGLHEFSMSASSVLLARELLSRLSKQEWSRLAVEALSMSSQQEVLDFVNNQLRSEA